MDLEFQGNVSTLKPFNYRKIKFVRHLVLDHKTEKLQSFDETDKGRNKCLVQSRNTKLVKTYYFLIFTHVGQGYDFNSAYPKLAIKTLG
jgi:hypothetical protein